MHRTFQTNVHIVHLSNLCPYLPYTSLGNKLKSYFWDGVANYSVTGQSEAAQEEAEKQEENRLDEFGDWLENNDEELPEEFRLRTE